MNSAICAAEHSPSALTASRISHRTGLARTCMVWVSSTTMKGMVSVVLVSVVVVSVVVVSGFVFGLAAGSGL